MKKVSFKTSLLLFFLCLFGFGFCFYKISNQSVFTQNSCFATDQSFVPQKYKFNIDGKIFEFREEELSLKLQISEFQEKMRKLSFEKSFKILQNMGLSKKEAITYIYPETKEILNRLSISTFVEAQSEGVLIVSNACELFVKEGQEGRFLNETLFFEKIYEKLKQNQNLIEINLNTEEFSLPKIDRKEIQEKSCFSTNFETSSASRKNNIKVALKAFDGIILEDGEVLSFNSITGARNEKSGYQKAKIISGGTFTEGFGGGVCQVSTTLYNACLLSGLEILEVHNHSLPVSYIEPSFDAMVNTGSSDLVVRNNTGGRIIFTTSSEGDKCKVKIFGKPNKFKITRFSEKTKIIPAENEEVLTNYAHLGEFDLKEGEERRISYKKDGFCSNGYLNFYDAKGTLVKTQKIRSNKYNPTRGIVIKNAG